MAGYAFITLLGQNSANVVHGGAILLSRQSESPLYDVGLFDQFITPAAD
jgi:hypothetical protein